MPLTDLQIRNFQPAERPFKKRECLGLSILGLYIEVTLKWSKLWRLKYRIYGAERRLAMGRYREVGLAEARTARGEARVLLAAGRDLSI